MSKLRSILFLLAGFCIILVIVHYVGVGDVLDVLSHTNPLFVGGAVACQGGAMLMWAVRWRILVKSFHKIKLKNALIGIFIGVFFNNITPIAKAGGEPFRAYYLGEKEGIGFEDAFATVAIDRVVESFPFMVLIIISLIYFIFLTGITGQLAIILALALLLNIVLLVVVLYFSFSLDAAKRLMLSLFSIMARFSSRLRKYENKVEYAVERYHGAIKTLSSQGGNLAACLFISSLFWLMIMMRNYLVVIALGYKVDFMIIVVVQTVGTLTGIFPVLPGGLGSTDGLMIFLYVSFGFPAAIAVTASLLDRFISFWLMTILGAGIVFVEKDFLRERVLD